MSNMKIDNERLNQTIFESNKNNADLQSPNENDIKNFEKELNQKDEQEKYNQDNVSEQSNYNFESFFKNTFSQNTIEEIRAPLGNEIDMELTEKLVDQILVTDPKNNGEQEIRIRLDNDILKDTEICLTRSPEGSLHIQLNSNNINSIQTLAAQQYELKSRLEQLENNDVFVEINPDNQGQEQGNDSNKQSRGLFDLYEQYKQN